MDWNTYHTRGTRKKYLYRYLSLEKLIHFIQTGCLFLSRLDRLDDGLEGISPYELNEIRVRQNLLYKPENANPKIPDFQWDIMINSSRSILKQIKIHLKDLQQKRFVSCWFLGDAESIGMWDLYAPKGFMLRFERTYFQNLIKQQRNKESNKLTEIDLIVAGRIVYQNFDDMLTKEKESLLKYSVFRKHLTYQHEEEYRVVGFTSNESKQLGIEFSLGKIDDLDFHVFASPRMTSNSFKIYNDIFQHYTAKHKIHESLLKTWIEFKEVNIP